MPHGHPLSTMVAVNDVVIHAVTAGNPLAVPLVMIHGFTGSANGWGTHIEAFAAAGYRVIALDMLGHGSSSAPSDPARYAMKLASSDIIHVLENLGVQAGKAWLLGYSMGGRIALYTLFAGFFQGGILESASPGLAGERERLARQHSDANLADRIEREGVPAFIDYWEHIALFESQMRLPEHVQQQMHEQRLHNTARGLANSLRGIGTGVQPALHEQLNQLRIPILLIVGSLDAKFTTIGKEMHAALTSSTLVIIEGAGHTVHFERPDAFDRQVTAFLSGNHSLSNKGAHS